MDFPNVATIIGRPWSGLLLWGIVAFALSALLVVAEDHRPVDVISYTDYANSYYVAGHMVTTGSSSQFYPPEHTHSLYGTPFDAYARRLLPGVSQDAFFLFMHPPATALFFAPLPLLLLQTSVRLWQFINASPLMAASWLFSRYTGDIRHALILFFSAFTLPAVFQKFVIGQSSLLFGLLPLAAGALKAAKT